MSVEFTTGCPKFIEETLPCSGYPSNDDYLTLFHALEGNPVFLKKQVIINKFGEWTPYEPDELASLVRSGVIYIEYCGTPMLYRGVAIVRPRIPVAERFSRFLWAIGKRLSAFPYNKEQIVTFQPKSIVWKMIPRYLPKMVDGRILNYPLDYGLVSYDEITKKGFWIPKDAPKASREIVVPDAEKPVTIRVYSCFGVRYGSGWYFYAARYRKYCHFGKRGIDPRIYAGYISEAVKGVVPGPEPLPPTIPPAETGPPPPTEPGPPPGCDPGRCPTPRPTISRGSTGPCVGLAQQLLLRAGYSPGPVDCVFGPQTESAVRDFQQVRGLLVDGIIGPQTWAALAAAPLPIILENREKCLQQGGIWDEATQTCKFIRRPPTPWLLWVGIGVGTLLAAAAGYHLARGSPPKKPEE